LTGIDQCATDATAARCTNTSIWLRLKAAFGVQVVKNLSARLRRAIAHGSAADDRLVSARNRRSA